MTGTMSTQRDRDRRDRQDRRDGLWLLAAFLIACLILGARTPVQAQDSTTGSLTTTGGVVTVALFNTPSETVQVSGTWIGVLLFELTADNGTTWKPLTVSVYGTGELTQATVGNGLFTVQNAGFTAARVRAASMQSGTVTVTMTRGYSTAAAPASPCNLLLHAAGKC